MTKDELVKGLTTNFEEILTTIETELDLMDSKSNLFPDEDYRRYVLRSAARRLVYGPPKPGTKEQGPLMKAR